MSTNSSNLASCISSASVLSRWIWRIVLLSEVNKRLRCSLCSLKVEASPVFAAICINHSGWWCWCNEFHGAARLRSCPLNYSCLLFSLPCKILICLIWYMKAMKNVKKMVFASSSSSSLSMVGLICHMIVARFSKWWDSNLLEIRLDENWLDLFRRWTCTRWKKFKHVNYFNYSLDFFIFVFWGFSFSFRFHRSVHFL